jgi:hypothetical protein
MTQVGEPVAMTTVGDAPSLKGAVTKLSFSGSLRVFINKSLVQPPHWEVGVDLADTSYRDTWRLGKGGSGAHYSKRPAVVKVPGAGGNMEVKVIVKITESKNVSGTGKLIGILGTLTIEGECPVSAGTHTVTAKITNMPDEIGWYRGKIVWGVEVESAQMSAPLNSSFAELFAILDDPLQPAFATGVWVEALRLACEEARLVGVALDDKPTAAARAVKYCFYDHNLFYDCTSGAPSFGVGGPGGTFELEKYLKQGATFANCYDQAGAIQVLAGCVGVHLTWIYLAPFGYIHTTRLLGWHVEGLCNNPFFNFDLTKMLLPRFHPDRDPFGNHAFCEYSGRVYDACAKPQMGSADRDGYCRDGIDDDPRLYGPGLKMMAAGTPARFGVRGGVTAVT